MNHLIQSKSQIETRCQEIQSYLEITISEEPAELVDRGNTLSVYMAQSGKMLADAKYHRDKAVKESVLNKMDTGLSPTTLNKLIDADCEEENYLVNWCDRINRTCVHQSDWCRSLLSKAKEEMKMGSWQT